MADTPNFGFPLLAADQAQKHITHNEAITEIDEALGRVATIGSQGSSLKMVTLEETLTLAGTSVTSTAAFPDECVIVGCAVRVGTTITGAASFDVGDGTDVDRFGASIGLPSGTINQGTVTPLVNSAVTNVTLTANGGTFSAGTVRVALAYMEITVPTTAT